MITRPHHPLRLLAASVGCLMIAMLSGTPAAGARSGTYSFAPYVDMTQYPAPNLLSLKRASGIHQATLAFITAQSGSACAPTWGGYSAYPASGHGAYQLAGVSAFRRAGGTAVTSFGGQAGTELAAACPTASTLQHAYATVIAAYRPGRIDFDIEGSALNDPAAATRRSEAIAALQRAATAKHRSLPVSFTLPVLPSGLQGSALNILRSAIRHGVKLSLVNLMAMDYGDSAAPHPQGHMAAYAIHAAGAVGRQLHRLYPHLNAAARGRLVGLTPMIGVNDVSTETFTLADAGRLAAYARAGHVGALSMWQLERDRRCAAPSQTAQVDCSSVSQRPYQFARTLEP